MGFSLLFILKRHTHTGSIFPSISCASAAFLCHHWLSVHASMCIFPQRATTHNDTSIRLSSQQSVKRIDNLLHPSQSNPSKTITLWTTTNHLCFSPSFPWGFKPPGCGGGRMEEKMPPSCFTCMLIIRVHE